MGLSEMINEPGTQDGFSRNNIDDPDLPKSIVRAVDGLQFNGLHMRKAFKAGTCYTRNRRSSRAYFLYGLFRCNYIHHTTYSCRRPNVGWRFSRFSYRNQTYM